MSFRNWLLNKGIGLRHILIFVSESNHKLTAPSSHKKFEIVDIEPHHLQQIREIRGERKKNHLQYIISIGAVGKAIIRDGGIVCYGMSGLNKKDHPEKLYTTFEIPSNSAHIFECYTHPKYRGKGLYSSVVYDLARNMKELRCEKIYIDCLVDNIPAKKGIQRLGFKASGYLKSYIICNYTIHESGNIEK